MTSTAINMTTDIMDDFDKYLDDLKYKLTPFEYKGVYYVKYYTTGIVDTSIFDTLIQRCHVCKPRLKDFIRIEDQNGPILMSDKLNDEQKKHIKDICKGEYTIIVLTSKLLFNKEKIEGPFPHLFFESVFTPSEKKPNLITMAIRDYISTGMIDFLIANILKCNDNSPHEAIRSLECFITCADKATYGKKFIFNARWLISIFNNIITTSKPNERVHIYFKALLDTKIEEGLPNKEGKISGVIVTSYHQSNDNILGLLRDAKSESAMTTLIENRLNPYKYQQKAPDAILKQGNIENTEKLLGEFKNEIYCHEELASLPHCITFKDTLTSSMDAFAAMKLNNKKTTSTSFASKCSKLNFTTIKTVVDYLRSHPTSKVEVNTLNQVPVYIAKTTLFPEKTNYPHLWLFDPSIIVMSGWCKVKHILPMYEYIDSHKNIAFILETKDIINKDKIKNCCLPEFLITKYNKVCGVAFQRINEMVQITMKHTDLAIGIGSSLSYMKMVRPLRIKINGEEMTITSA